MPTINLIYYITFLVLERYARHSGRLGSASWLWAARAVRCCAANHFAQKLVAAHRGGRCAYSTAPALHAYTHLRLQAQLAPTGPHHHHDKPGVVAGELYPYTLSRIRRLASGLPPEGQLPTSGAFEMVEIPDSNLEL